MLNACKGVSKSIAIINKVKYALRKDSLSSLYTSIIEPHLTYGVAVWVNAHRSNMNPLYVRQRCLIRLITKYGHLYHTTNLFQSWNIFPFFHLIKYKVDIFMHKVYYEIFPLTTFLIFTHYIISIDKVLLFINYSGTSNRQQCIVYTGVRVWNSLELDFIKSKNLRLLWKIVNAVLCHRSSKCNFLHFIYMHWHKLIILMVLEVLHRNKC